MLQRMYVGADGDVMLFTRRPDLPQARHTSNVEDIRIWIDSAGVNLAQQLIAELQNFQLNDAQLGV